MYRNSSEPSAEPGAGSSRACSASRALELAVGGIRSRPNHALARLAAEFNNWGRLSDLARDAAGLPGLSVRTGHWRPEAVLGAVGAGAAVIAEASEGWVIIVPGPLRRPRIIQVGIGREQRSRATARKIEHAVGSDLVEGIVLEPEFGLQSLEAPAAGSTSPWARLAALLALEKPDFMALVLYAVVIGGLSLAVPVAVQVLVNTIALGSLLQPLVILSGLLLAVLGFSGAIQIMQGYAVEVVQRRLFVRVAEDFARRLPHLRLDVHDRVHGPELANRFFEVVGLQKSLSRLLIDGSSLFLQTVVGLLLLAFYHPFLLAFDAVLLAALGLVAALGWGGARTAVAESKAKYRVAAWLQGVAAQPHSFSHCAGKVVAATTADALT